MRAHAALLALLILSPLSASAGGDSFIAEIVSLTAEGPDRHRLELMQHTPPYAASGDGLPQRLVIHLRFNERLFTRACRVCPTREKHIAAIDRLKAQAARGGRFPFGIMSRGFEPIKGRKGEFQSNGLSILKEFDGREVVYSFAKMP